MWLACKQMWQYGLESIIDNSSEVENVYDCCLPLLSVKTASAWSPMFEMESNAKRNIQRSTFVRLPSWRFNMFIVRLTIFPVRGLVFRAWTVQKRSACRKSSLIENHLFDAQLCGIDSHINMGSHSA